LIRRLAVLSSLALAAMAFALPPADRADEGAVRRASHTITITLKCETRDGFASPDTLRIKQGDTVYIELSPDSDVSNFVVTPKPRMGILPGAWPYRTRQLTGGPGNRAAAADMKPNAEGHYRYNAQGACPGGPPAKFDPDIIVEL